MALAPRSSPSGCSQSIISTATWLPPLASGASGRNLAIVFGPNLLVTDDSAHEAPMQTLVMSQKSVYFMERLIEWQMLQGYHVDPADCKSPSSTRSLFD